MNSDGNVLEGMVTGYLDRLRATLDVLPAPVIMELVRRLHAAYREERGVFIVGNGGSASTASHMACDLAKNLFVPGKPASPSRFRVFSLVDNVASITAYANDLGYDWIFSEQLKSLAVRGDTLVAISASGNSPNVVEATRVARRMGLQTIGILGFGGGKLKDLVDLPVIVASDEYGPVEDVHMVLNHLVTACLKTMISR
jgi:D-sedoheptulose 7-phosphate isomerase